MTLSSEIPSMMVQQAYSIPYSAYQMDLWQHLLAGVCIGAWMALTITFMLVEIAQRRRG